MYSNIFFKYFKLSFFFFFYNIFCNIFFNKIVQDDEYNINDENEPSEDENNANIEKKDPGRKTSDVYEFFTYNPETGRQYCNYCRQVIFILYNKYYKLN